MKSLEQEQSRPFSRRKFLWGTAGMIGATAAAGSMLTGCPDGALPDLDPEILNFALNLEYLEAEFYTRAVGMTLSDVGSSPGTVTGGKAVNFTTPAIRNFALELASDEAAHVTFLRTALGAAAVDRPAIDLQNSFTAAAIAAGLISANQTFDAFKDETNFLAAAFIFEDVGVTAYKGASPLITSKVFLEAAAGILATEAYHAGALRTFINAAGAAATANAISNARDSLDGTTDVDQGASIGGVPNLVPTDENGIAFSRTVSQVLHVVYLTPNAGVGQGGFFPNGVNGPAAFKTT